MRLHDYGSNMRCRQIQAANKNWTNLATKKLLLFSRVMEMSHDSEIAPNFYFFSIASTWSPSYISLSNGGDLYPPMKFSNFVNHDW